MKKISATTKLTLSAMSTALSVVFLYAASVIPTAKLALILCIALDKKFEDLFYFD